MKREENEENEEKMEQEKEEEDGKHAQAGSIKRSYGL